MIITLYETNSDQVCAQMDDGPVWEFGAVTYDMYGKFAEDAAAWCDGDWEPNEGDGQRITDDQEGLVSVATWNSDRRSVAHLEPSTMGGAARLYVTGSLDEG